MKNKNDHAEHPQPLEWIQLELVPLPSFEQAYPERLLWWNPSEGSLIGEGADLILLMIEEAMTTKVLHSSSLNHFELTDPLKKPTELAAILGQYYWVIPLPVESPGLLSSEDSKNRSTLQ
ncbi:MAG: hypothetical protein U9R28_05265 [Pseudomonadota bacterium]|nr:hypothetical protein [Pseudomonadota bacterium]